ncbi:Protein SDA1 [Nymphon striatum]|nr:Protein SDA1 [Nymphon striatum]
MFGNGVTVQEILQEVKEGGGFLQQHRHYQSNKQLYLLHPDKHNKILENLTMFMAQVSHCYPEQLSSFPQEIIDILKTHATVLNPEMRMTFCKSLILLRNKSLLAPTDLLSLFFELLQCQDKQLRKFLQAHIITDIKNVNNKRKNSELNSTLQTFMYNILKDSNTVAAKMSLDVMIELYKKNVWNDAKTVNVITNTCFSKTTKVMVAALKFFLGSEEDEESDDESDDDGPSVRDVMTANKFNKKTRKRKKNMDKVKSVVKKSKKKNQNKVNFNFSALHLIHDPQSFAEKLYKHVDKMTERFEVKLMVLNLISRLIGVHQLFLFNFYPLLQRFIKPHQREVTKILQFAAQATHELIPPDVLEPVMMTIANNFITESNSSEVITVGLNTIREMCVRCPLMMNEDLLHDFSQYKNYKDKSVILASRALIVLYRNVNPAMLMRKDRGKPTEATREIVVKQYGELDNKDFIPGAEKLKKGEEEDSANDGWATDEEEQDDSDGSWIDVHHSSDEEGVLEEHKTCTFLEDFNVATTRIAEAAKNKETANHLPEVKKCIADLKTFLKSFDQELKSSATFVFWRQYMDIVQILLQFISAEREGLWQLHLSSFARMLPWMAVYDHINYLRWGTVYLSDMYQLATTAPVVFDEFEKGNFVVKESDGKFNQVSADLALEHVSKLGSGPSTTKAEPEHKESGKKRMEKDEEDVLHLVNQFTRFKVFDRNESERICISTNDVAPPDVAKDLLHAESNGKKVVETFINERLTDKTRSLYDRVSKQNSKTFAAMSKSKPVVKDRRQKSVKAERGIFRRLLVASEGGRKVDLKQVLSYELTEVPYTLSNADGTIRTTDKAALAHILADEYTETCLPAANGKSTCCIIDGMALVQSIGNPARCTSFGDLSDTFVRSVHSCLTDSCTRVDVPFDHYCTLPAFHAVTGCDSTSQFAGHGKKKAWQAYIKDPTVLNQFGRAEVSERLMSNAEKFVDTNENDLMTVEEKRKVAAEVTQSRILSQEDFKKIKIAQLAKHVDPAHPKNKSSSLKDVKVSTSGGELVSLSDIERVHRRPRHDKESRLATVMGGREGREKFGKAQKRSNPHASTTDKEKSKKKAFMMIKHKLKHKQKRSFRDKQIALKKSLLKQKRSK